MSLRREAARRAAAVLVGILACLCLVGAVDVSRGSAAVTAEFDGRRVEGVEIRLYHVAEPSGEWTPGFADYGLRLDADSESSVGATAATLRALIARDEVPADWAVETDASGVARFDGLAPGVWLVLGDDHVARSTTYRVRAGMFVLHSSEERDVEIKYETETPPGEPGGPATTIRKVVKVWDDDGVGRPASVAVELLRDGRVHDSVELSDRNGWRHTWTGLDARREWTVVEVEVPRGYECVVERDGVTTVVTNVEVETTVETPPESPPDVPTGPVDPGDPGGPTTPADPGEPEIPVSPGEPGGPGPKIPRTGTTWYLVPATAGLGVLSALVGWWLLRGGDDDDA